MRKMMKFIRSRLSSDETGQALIIVLVLLVMGSLTIIPVLAHIGYTPQHSLQFGRKVVRGREKDAAAALIADAKALEEAGAFAMVLECLPRKLASEITRWKRISRSKVTRRLLLVRRA